LSIPACRISQQRTIRLISTAHHKPPVLQTLATTFGSLTALEDLESVTSGRLEAEQKGIPGIGPDAMASGYGYTYINAAFAYPRPNGNRFNPAHWGAWYASFDDQTSLKEVTYHLTRALEAAGGYYDNTTRYLELLADFDADFADLRNLKPLPACLNADVSIGYPEGQRLAEDLRREGSNGIVYPSIRHNTGTCLAVFWPGLIQNFQFGATWEIVWSGDPIPKVTKVAAP
jgi:RES domain